MTILRASKKQGWGHGLAAFFLGGGGQGGWGLDRIPALYELPWKSQRPLQPLLDLPINKDDRTTYRRLLSVGGKSSWKPPRRVSNAIILAVAGHQWSRLQ